VYLLDVCGDPAVEQQAIARVHRIGQARPVTITRLLCADTVEVQVLQVSAACSR
jgi:SNF2 family DNA or RNA helicase